MDTNRWQGFSDSEIRALEGALRSRRADLINSLFSDDPDSEYNRVETMYQEVCDIIYDRWEPPDYSGKTVDELLALIDKNERLSRMTSDEFTERWDKGELRQVNWARDWICLLTVIGKRVRPMYEQKITGVDNG